MSISPQRMNIFLVDDHPMVRERLTEIINHQPDLRVCGEAEDAPEAFGAIDKLLPDLVIVDLTLKRSHGLELVKQLKASHPRTPVLVLSMHDELIFAERALRADARGYITKQEATTRIMAAIRCVLSGNVFVSESVVARMLQRTAQASQLGATPTEALADRELEVFQLIGRGLNMKEIAQQLRISVKSVETYRARIKEKLNLERGSELLREAMKWLNDPR